MIKLKTLYLDLLEKKKTRIQNRSSLKEAIPYSIVGDYLKIERSAEVKSLLNEIFKKLKSLPNATQIDKRGDRIAIPYEGMSLEKEIVTRLSKFDFDVKDFNKGIAIDTRNNREIRIGKAINIISKKPGGYGASKDLLNLYSFQKGKNVLSQDMELALVFSKHPYDIVGMSTGRSWISCMGIRKKDQFNDKDDESQYVKYDIKKGTIICYLARVSDRDLKNPLGRVLIKPYINIRDEKDIIFLTQGGDDFGFVGRGTQFRDTVDEIMEKIQNITGIYKLDKCLYPDIGGLIFRAGKEGAIEIAKQAIEQKKQLERNMYPKLPEDMKKKYLEMAMKHKLELTKTQYEDLSEEDKQIYQKTHYGKFDPYEGILKK